MAHLGLLILSLIMVQFQLAVMGTSDGGYFNWFEVQPTDMPPGYSEYEEQATTEDNYVQQLEEPSMIEESAGMRTSDGHLWNWLEGPPTDMPPGYSEYEEQTTVDNYEQQLKESSMTEKSAKMGTSVGGFGATGAPPRYLESEEQTSTEDNYEESTKLGTTTRAPLKIPQQPTSTKVADHDLDNFALTLQSPTSSGYYGDFLEYEKNSKSYMNNMKKTLLSVLSSYSTSFHREVQSYMMQSPTRRSLEITKYTRETCDCDGARMTPCPLKCLYSCYGSESPFKSVQYYEDCRYRNLKKCECYKAADYWGAAEYCDRGNSLENCYTATTEVETIASDPACLKLDVDDKNVSKSFEVISAVLVEPIKKHFRGIDTELYYLKETSLSVDHSIELEKQLCHALPKPIKSTCENEAIIQLKSEIDLYREVKSNITKQLRSTQKLIRNAHQSFREVKEQHFAHISQAIEKLACCLRAAGSMTIPKVDCTTYSEKVKDESANRFKECGSGYFLCKSGKYIPWQHVCDNDPDCPDQDDEVHCID